MAYVENTDSLGNVVFRATIVLHQLSSFIQDCLDEGKIRLGVGYTLSVREG